MDEPLADIEQLAERLPFVMDDDETREATGALEDLSDEARFYGKPQWINPTVTPQPVIRLILRAAQRHMKNYEGFTTSRAGDETAMWTDRGESSGSATFTADEKARIKEYGGNQRPGFYSVNTFAATRRPRQHVAGLVPAQGGGMIPYFADDCEPW